MTPTTQHLHTLMLLLACFCSIDAAAQHHTAVPCLPDQASSLLQLKRSFIHANLSSWRAGKDCCHWEGVTCDVASGRVISLHLDENVKIRRIDPVLLNLTSLKSLSLSTTGIYEGLSSLSKLPSLDNLELDGWPSWNPVGPELSSIVNIKQLTSLLLEGYDFSKSVPSWIGNLTSLTSLSIYGCNFTGPIPYQIGYLANLTMLDFESCNYTGQPIPSWIGNLTKLTDLGIQGCKSYGTIPSTIGNWTKLKSLQIGYNDKLTGRIPKSVFALPALEFLLLNNNQLSGPLDIPSPLSSPLSLIQLQHNQLTGPIPKSLFQLKYLEYLNLESNRLSGTIELSSFWNFQNLSFLSLSNNMLSIAVDDERDSLLYSLPNINYLYLGSCNLKKLPTSLRYFKVLDLDISSNKINGVIPSWLWENLKDHVVRLNISHNMFTTLEKSPSLVHMPNLTVLDLSFNNLQGSIPIPVTSKPGEVLDYSNNNFSSIVPNFGRYIRSSYLNLSKNKLNGHVSSSICSASHLNIMDLSYNNFSGSVPSCLIKSGKLTVLKLRENKINGSLPENIGEECKFQTIDLNGNQIEGKIPRSLSNCQELELLDFSNNLFDGPIPESIGSLVSLHGLNMSYNNLTGKIPSSFGNLSLLESLDLSWNRISGEIPQELTSLTSLAWLNLSYNNLAGRIPQVNQFLSFPNSSFEGNVGLCGNPLSKQCASPDSIALDG